MSLYAVMTVFITVFMAELGDKTQLASLLFATDESLNPWLVFAVASLALTASTGIAVLLGAYAARYIEVVPVQLLAGVGFILIGCWTVYGHFKG
ncbi:TMEM165/GDT1 family protein [Pyruvatibacter sp.]|uniref:TMEM165/GDT1 family protein n=1 Tax=Pyruvatibacter sp. TaxID=1981328 RepID=UPI0032EBBAEA